MERGVSLTIARVDIQPSAGQHKLHDLGLGALQSQMEDGGSVQTIRALRVLSSLIALEMAVVSPLRRISKRRNVRTDCSRDMLPLSIWVKEGRPSTVSLSSVDS